MVHDVMVMFELGHVFNLEIRTEFRYLYCFDVYNKYCEHISLTKYQPYQNLRALW